MQTIEAKCLKFNIFKLVQKKQQQQKKQNKLKNQTIRLPSFGKCCLIPDMTHYSLTEK